MDIIAHTEEVNQNKQSLINLKNNPFYTKIKIDLRLTKDYQLIWSHDRKINGNMISNTNYADLGEVLTLEDILEIMDHAKPLLLEVKGYSKFLQKKAYIILQSLLILYYYNNKVELESFHESLIATFLQLQKKGEINFMELGLVINLFTTFKYRSHFPNHLKGIQFISLANELFEFPIVGQDYQKYRELLTHVRQYAWSTNNIFDETEERIRNYIAKGVDGIVTSYPAMVKRLIK